MYKDLLPGDIIRRTGDMVDSQYGKVRTGEECVFSRYENSIILHIDGYRDTTFFVSRFEFVRRPSKFQLDDDLFTIS